MEWEDEQVHETKREAHTGCGEERGDDGPHTSEGIVGPGDDRGGGRDAGEGEKLAPPKARQPDGVDGRLGGTRGAGVARDGRCPGRTHDARPIAAPNAAVTRG